VLVSSGYCASLPANPAITTSCNGWQHYGSSTRTLLGTGGTKMESYSNGGTILFMLLAPLTSPQSHPFYDSQLSCTFRSRLPDSGGDFMDSSHFGLESITAEYLLSGNGPSAGAFFSKIPSNFIYVVALAMLLCRRSCHMCGGGCK